MKREASARLDQWLQQPDRKPLIIRGARQKTVSGCARRRKQPVEIGFRLKNNHWPTR